MMSEPPVTLSAPVCRSVDCTASLQVQSPGSAPPASQIDWDATAALQSVSWSVTAHHGVLDGSQVHEPAASQSP